MIVPVAHRSFEPGLRTLQRVSRQAPGVLKPLCRALLECRAVLAEMTARDWEIVEAVVRHESISAAARALASGGGGMRTHIHNQRRRLEDRARELVRSLAPLADFGLFSSLP